MFLLLLLGFGYKKSRPMGQLRSVRLYRNMYGISVSYFDVVRKSDD